MHFFDKSNTVAKKGYNRWKMLPVALSIHLCIGQIYAFSVFNLPLTRVLGISTSLQHDWKLTQLGWIFSLALFFLGAAAAVFGKWVERQGPRKAMFFSAILFSSGFLISAIGTFYHQLWLLYLGSGVVGGIGLGLGYIAPVSTLIKWFPDRPGMATGMAIMGFGGGAMIASPLSVFLMDMFSSAYSVGVGETFLCLAFIYALVMMYGVYFTRVPVNDYLPLGFDPSRQSKRKLLNVQDVDADTAIRTPQFYLLFLVLMLNVTAGIGVLGQASVMIQETFGSVDDSGIRVNAAFAAGFVGILSLFNMIGRFFWSSLSDYIGRKWTYGIFFSLGPLLFMFIPLAGEMNSVILFVAAFCIILTMYGGGFATIPAYLRDTFGTMQVGAIHGRILLAWSLAAILGPAIINYMREYQIEQLQMPPSQVYTITMYVMAGLLVLGFLCNALISPVNQKYHFKKIKLVANNIELLKN
ncbi:MAG: OFA family MFS transporter [Vicingaceae bacterium]